MCVNIECGHGLKLRDSWHTSQIKLILLTFFFLSLSKGHIIYMDFGMNESWGTVPVKD